MNIGAELEATGLEELMKIIGGKRDGEICQAVNICTEIDLYKNTNVSKY